MKILGKNIKKTETLSYDVTSEFLTKTLEKRGGFLSLKY